MWIGAQQKYSLSDVAIARYVPDESLCTYSLTDCASDVETIDDPSSSHASGSIPAPAASQRSSETLYDDCSVEEVWYGEAGQAEKEKLAAPRVVEEKPSKAGRGKSVGKGNAKKAKNKDGGKKERIRKATNVKVKKKGANK